MKTSDIPTLPILKFIGRQGGIGCNWFEKKWPKWDFENKVMVPGEFSYNDNTVLHGMPEDVPRKLALSKMRKLLKQGLVGGCACGCRGDWELTDKGWRALTEECGESCPMCGGKGYFIQNNRYAREQNREAPIAQCLGCGYPWVLGNNFDWWGSVCTVATELSSASGPACDALLVLSGKDPGAGAPSS